MLSFVGKRSLAAIAGMSLALAGLVAIAPTATAAGAKEICGTGIADNKYDSDLIAWKTRIFVGLLSICHWTGGL